MVHIEDFVDILLAQPDARFSPQKALFKAKLANLGEILSVYVADGQILSCRIDDKSFAMAVLPVYKEFTVWPQAALTGIQSDVHIHQAAVAGGVVRNEVETAEGFTGVSELYRETIIFEPGPESIQPRTNPFRAPGKRRGCFLSMFFRCLSDHGHGPKHHCQRDLQSRFNHEIYPQHPFKTLP